MFENTYDRFGPFIANQIKIVAACPKIAAVCASWMQCLWQAICMAHMRAVCMQFKNCLLYVWLQTKICGFIDSNYTV